MISVFIWKDIKVRTLKWRQWEGWDWDMTQARFKPMSKRECIINMGWIWFWFLMEKNKTVSNGVRCWIASEVFHSGQRSSNTLTARMHSVWIAIECANYAKTVISLPHVILYILPEVTWIFMCVCPLARIHTHIKLSVWPCLSTDTEKNHPATSPQYF